jgi:hypothetical protein
MERLAFDSLLLFSCIIAWFRGGDPEKKAATMLFSAATLSWLVVDHGATMFSQIEWRLFIVDFMLAVALLILAISADRYWPMWLTALQIVSLLMHPAFGLSQSKMAFAYAVAVIAWSYPMLIILIVGTIRHTRRSTTDSKII